MTEAVVPVYRSGNVPQFFTSSATELTRLGQGNTFRLVANDELQSRAIASYAGETLHASKIAIVHEDTAYGAPLAKGMTDALAKQNKKVEYSEAIDNKTTNFAPFVAKLKTARPEVVVAMVRDHQLLPLFDQMNAAGLGDVPVIATSVAKTQRAATSAGIRTLYLTTPAPPRSTSSPAARSSSGNFAPPTSPTRSAGRRTTPTTPSTSWPTRSARRIGRSGSGSGPADGHRRDRAGDDDDAFQRRRRAALRRHQRLPATRLGGGTL